MFNICQQQITHSKQTMTQRTSQIEQLLLDYPVVWNAPDLTQRVSLLDRVLA